MYNPTSSPRKAFSSLAKPTNEETISGFRSIVFNSGPYALIENSTLLAIPDIAKVPGFEGGRQFYAYQIKGDRLEFKLFDETYPNGQKPEWYGHLEVLLIFEKEN